MRITQSYTGTYSHTRSWKNSKDYKDYPIDDGGKDGGREGIYCPCDEMKVTAIKGVKNNSITNTIWLVSTSKVITPTFTDYAFMVLTHSNNVDFKNIKVGKKFKRGELIVKEGENVNVATHIHMSFGRGTSNNWLYNSNGQIVVKGDTKKPEEVCYLDKSFTNVINSGGIKWVVKPTTFGTPVKRNNKVPQIEVLVDNLRARKTANGTILGYVRKGIYNTKSNIKTGGYVWYNVEDFWMAYSATWAKLYQKEEAKEKEEIVPKENIEVVEKEVVEESLTKEPVTQPDNKKSNFLNFIKRIFAAIKNFFKRL